MNEHRPMALVAGALLAVLPWRGCSPPARLLPKAERPVKPHTLPVLVTVRKPPRIGHCVACGKPVRLAAARGENIKCYKCGRIMSVRAALAN